MRKLLLLVIIILYAFSASGDAFASENPSFYDETSSFLFLRAQVFDVKQDPSVSIFCKKGEMNGEWDGGCPGELESGEELPTPVDTGQATMYMCNVEIGMMIVNDGESHRVYDPNMGDQSINSIEKCEYGHNGQLAIIAGEDYDCSLDTCTEAGGYLYKTRTSAKILHINMNREGVKRTGNKGDLNWFRLADPNDGGYNNAEEGIRMVEYDTTGNDVETKEPRKNFIYDSEKTEPNNFIKPENQYPEDCGSDPCRVANTDFTGSKDDVTTGQCKGADDGGKGYCPIGYKGGDRDVVYDPQVEIIYGTEYGYNDVLESDNDEFHICEDWISALHGKTVYSPGDNYEYDQFKCTSNGWENVAVCNDGVDNDGDGQTDTADDECDSASDYSESTEPKCPPVVGYESSNKENKVAFYDSSGSTHTPYGSRCTYGGKDISLDHSPLPEPNKFGCNEDGSIWGDVYSEDLAPIEKEDAEIYCSQQVPDHFFYEHGAVPMAEYFVPKEAMPTVDQNEEAAKKFATPNGFRNHFYQDLHTAEREYNKPKFAGTLDETGVHDAESYQKLDMASLDDGYSDGDYYRSWVVENAAADNDRVASGQDTVTGEPLVSADSVFPGGFAGECKNSDQDKWRLNAGDWQCDPYTTDRDFVWINPLEGTRDSKGNFYAGFMINESEYKRWETTMPFSNVYGTPDLDPLKIDAQCSMGETPPADVSKVENVTVDVRQGEPAVVVAKLPERSNVNENKWNCHFGFRQRTGDVSNIPLASNVQPFNANADATESGEAYFVQGLGNKDEGISVISGDQLRMEEDTDDSDNTETIAEFMKKHYEADYTHVRDSIWEEYPKTGSEQLRRNPCRDISSRSC